MKKLLLLGLLSFNTFASGWLQPPGSGGGGGSMAIGGAVTGGTSDSVLFVDGSGNLGQDPSFFSYDTIHTRLCLGCDVTTSTQTFHLLGSARFESLSTGLGHFDSSGVLSSSLLVNADVSGAAAIALSKLAALSNSVVPVTNASGVITSSAVTATTLGFLDATSSIQTQLNGKEPTQTKGSISTTTTGVTIGSGSSSTVGPAVTVNIQNATTAQPGLLTAADWTTFNGKQASGNYITSLTTDVVASGAGAAAATIQANVVTNAKLAQAATLTLKGNNTGVTANVSDLTVAQVNTMLGSLSNPMTTGGDTIYGGVSGVPTRLPNGSAGQYFQSNGGTAAPSYKSFAAMTVQKFTSGSGTYTTPAGVLYIRVRMVGAGGGGDRGGTTGGTPTAGGNTTFGTTLLVSNGGSAGATSNGGVGGTTSLGTGPVGINIDGAKGQGGLNLSSGSFSPPGGAGGTSFFGGPGAGSAGANGTSASTNSGSGGAGGAINATATHITGAGGGAGGYVDAIITSPSATYSYAVGGPGSGASGGDFTGGNGAAGLIIVEEHYQ